MLIGFRYNFQRALSKGLLGCSWRNLVKPEMYRYQEELPLKPSESKKKNITVKKLKQ